MQPTSTIGRRKVGHAHVDQLGNFAECARPSAWMKLSAKARTATARNWIGVSQHSLFASRSNFEVDSAVQRPVGFLRLVLQVDLANVSATPSTGASPSALTLVETLAMRTSVMVMTRYPASRPT